jgi:hypothetical protein
MEEKEYISLLEINLSVLVSYGTHYLNSTLGNALLLKMHFTKEIELSDEKLNEILKSIDVATQKHQSMLRLSIEQRRNYTNE